MKAYISKNKCSHFPKHLVENFNRVWKKSMYLSVWVKIMATKIRYDKLKSSSCTITKGLPACISVSLMVQPLSVVSLPFENYESKFKSYAYPIKLQQISVASLGDIK